MKTISIFVTLLFVFVVSFGYAQYQYTVYTSGDVVIKTQDNTNYNENNYETDERFIANVKTIGADLLKERSLIAFDLSVIPVGKVIYSAYLHLDGEDHASSQTDQPYIRLIDASWEASTVTWDNQPTYIAQDEVELGASSSAGEDYVIDVTDIATLYYEDSDSYYGFIMMYPNEISDDRKQFYSDDTQTQGAKRPKLVITLQTPDIVIDIDHNNSQLYTINNDGNITVDVSGGVPPYTYSWAGTTGSSNSVSSLSPGSYTVTVTDSLSKQKSLTISIQDDAVENWTLDKAYDENGNVISQSKTYQDEMGRGVQSLSKDEQTGYVIASQTVYDSYGRAALQSLPAPTGKQLVYNDSFLTNSSGNIYDYSDFDSSSTIYSPNAVQKTKENSVGYYYSNSGPDEYAPTSSYPYVRTLFTPDQTERLRSISPPGDEMRLGKNKETKKFYYFSDDELTLVYGANKSPFVTINSSDKLVNTTMNMGSNIPAMKIVTVDGEGKVYVEYKYMGLTLVTARGVTGSMSGSTPYRVNQRLLFINTSAGPMTTGTFQSSVDLHIVQGTDDSLKLPLPEYNREYVAEVAQLDTMEASELTISLYDLYNDKQLTITTDYSINSTTRAVTFNGSYATGDKYLRVVYELKESFVTTVASNGGDLPTGVTLPFALNYTHWQVNYFDQARRLRKKVTPEGFAFGGNHSMYTTYDYDSRGNLIGVNDPDEGKTEMIYNKHDNLRFAQDAQQALSDKFSYSNYDDLDRILEQGEYTTQGSGHQFQNYYGNKTIGGSYTSSTIILNDEDGLNDSYCDQVTSIYYYTLDAADDINHTSNTYAHKAQYESYFHPGLVSRISNDYSNKWIGYDNRGRITYCVQQILDVDYTSKTTVDEQYKTLDFTYDSDNGTLEKKEYQKHETSELLAHHYTYDNNLRVSDIRIADNSNDNLANFSYEYNLIGQVKRQVVGDNLQGVDYVYTINGALKSVNHSSLDESLDPGEDGNIGSEHQFLPQDLFAYTIDYYDGDYVRSGSSIESSSGSSSERFDGQIDAIRWKIKTKNKIGASTTLYTIGDVEKELMYDYSYDDHNRLSQATFGLFDNQTDNFTSRDEYAVWGETVSSVKQGISYDDNGNIEKLSRNGYEITTGVYIMDQLDYSYDGTKKNRLTGVEDLISSSGFSSDFSASSSDAYTYDAVGRLVDSDAEDIDDITYTRTGKVKKVTFDNGNYAEYTYDGSDFKSKLKVYTQSTGNSHHTWYVRNAAGGLVATFTRDEAESPSDDVEEDQQLIVGGEAALYKASGSVIYGLRDHLGNERVRFSKKANTEKYQSDFTSTTDGWSSFGGATLSAVSSKLKMSASSAQGGGFKAVSLDDNTSYVLSFDLDLSTTDTVTFKVATTSAGTTAYSTALRAYASGFYSYVFTTTQSGNSYVIIHEDGDATGSYDFKVSNVLVEERNKLTMESWQDLYPFGEQLPGRNSTGSNTSLYGYRGAEDAPETGWSDFELRMLNRSLGRWISPDPYHQGYSPYAAMGNNPVVNVDPNGGWYDVFYVDPTSRSRHFYFLQIKWENGDSKTIEKYCQGCSLQQWFESDAYKRGMVRFFGHEMTWRINTGHGYEYVDNPTEYQKRNGQWVTKQSIIDAKQAADDAYMAEIAAMNDRMAFEFSYENKAFMAMIAQWTAENEAFYQEHRQERIKQLEERRQQKELKKQENVSGSKLYASKNGGIAGEEGQDPTEFDLPGGVKIPSSIELENGDHVNITFGITKDGVSANRKVSGKLVSALEDALNIASETVNITTIHISASTNGVHGTNSNHYVKNGARALDISKINGEGILSLGTNGLVLSLQNAIDGLPNVRENFGPAFNHKFGAPYSGINGHKDHIHFSINP